MNVLHINQSDINGGAAIAGYRLHQGLLTKNIKSRMLVGGKTTDSSNVNQIARWGRVEKRLQRFTDKAGLNYVNMIGSFNIHNHSFYKVADVLNFHNLHTGYFNYLSLPWLTKNKPAVFTLHDMWSFTGHCAYSYDCGKWETGCGKCPYPDLYPQINLDSTAIEWKLKSWVYKLSDLTIVTPSKWLEKQARKSMLNRFDIQRIPYGLNLTDFQPLDKEKCQRELGIDSRKKVLMFAAQSVKDKRKGSDLLISALMDLPDSLKNEIVLLTIGKGGDTIAKTAEISHVDLGYINSSYEKSIAYSAADLFIFPTRADNLPLVLQESLACGTPIVSFDVGGVPDMVRPDITGYLAEPESISGLKEGIIKLLEDEDLRNVMSRNCRQIAVDEYSLDLQSKRYINLYKKLLSTIQYSPDMSQEKFYAKIKI